MKLTWITRKQAEWLGNAAAVAGGWVMTGDEWCNCSRAANYISGIPCRHLALLPENIEMGLRLSQAEIDRIIQLLRSDIACQWTISHYPEYIDTMQTWLDRILEATQPIPA